VALGRLVFQTEPSFQQNRPKIDIGVRANLAGETY
jgi:hypothetical protein